MAPSSRSRTIFSCTGRNQIGAHMDLHKLHPSPIPYKSFAERNESLDSLVHKRPFPRSPRPPALKQLSQPLHCPFDRVDVGANVDAALAEGKGNAGDLGDVETNGDQIGGA